MEIVAIPLTLIAIVGALFLLAKAQKDALHDIFKYASYFVLTLCIFTLSLVLIHAFDHKKGKHMIKMMRGGGPHEMDFHGMGGGHEDMMMFHQKMKGSDACPHMKKGTCCEENEGCEDGGKKEIIIKDTIIKK